MQNSSANSLNGQQAMSYMAMNDLASLRREAGQSPDTAMKKVAQQFEGLFISMMLKSMRQASFGDPLFNSHQSGLYRDMFDKQIALDMSSGRGLGLAQSLMVQLGRYVPQPVEHNSSAQDATALPLSSTPHGQILPRTDDAKGDAAAEKVPVTGGNTVSPVFNGPQSFVKQLWPLAQKAGKELGVGAPVLLAQAALETGWGRAVIRHANGDSSHNLFNIKADGRWSGDGVVKSTLEYRDGIAQQEKARFRAYDNFQDSFDDYVSFIKSSPRYAAALQVAGNGEKYLQQLQQAGYATDPSYANKILDIMQRDYFPIAGVTEAPLPVQG